MDVGRVLALRGPNIWAGFPVLEAWVDLGPLPKAASNQPTDFDEWLREWLPLEGSTSSAQSLARLVVELQRLVGSAVFFSHARATSQPGAYQIVCAYDSEELGRAALATACAMYQAVLQGQPLAPAVEVAKLRELAQRLRPAPLAAAVTQAARRRNVPVRPLASDLLLLGQGARQHRILGARTDRTSALAEAIASRADLTRKLLGEVGVPVVETLAPDAPCWRLVVVAGRVVAVQGPDSTAALDRVHPDVAARAIEAAEVVGLDVASVVLAVQDIAQPLGEADGVVAVEAAPAIEAATAETVGEALIAGLFPDDSGRVPVVAVTGVNGKTTTTRLLAHILAEAGRCVGMTCTEGIYIAGQLLEAGDCSGPRSAQTVLQHPEVEAAVLETARGGILRAGLGYDRCDVAVVTNVGEGDHLGLGGIETVEELARVKRVVVEAVRPGGTAVLNAADPLVAPMASHCRGTATFFACSADDPVIAAHRAAGGRAVFVREGRIVVARGEREMPVASLRRVPLTGGGRIGFQVENVLAAVAAAWALRIPFRTIRAALRTFGGGVAHTPARFNLLTVNGAVAVLDYGHNVSSLAAILQTLALFPPAYRTAVYTAAGDRRDADMIRQGELLGDAFDRVILYEDGNCTRGRQQGEIMGLFRQGLTSRPRVDRVEEVLGAVRAVDLALSSARPGELLLIQVDVVEETLELVRGYLAGAAAREVGLEEALASLGAGTAQSARLAGAAEALVRGLEPTPLPQRTQ